MNNWINFRTFPQNLKHWTLHVTICSAPSFLIACKLLRTSSPMILAMISGIITFILGYSLLSSSHLFQRISKGPLGPAVKYATRTRSALSLISLPIAILANGIESAALTLCPDYWAGFISGIALSSIWPTFESAVSLHNTSESGITINQLDTFLCTYSWVILEGLILSATLISLVFFFFALQNTFRKTRTTHLSS